MKSSNNEICLADHDLFLNSSATTKRIIHSWILNNNEKEPKIPESGLSSPQLKVKFNKNSVSWMFKILPHKRSRLDIDMNVMLDQLEEENSKSLLFFIKLYIIDNKQSEIVKFYKHLSVLNEAKYSLNMGSNERISMSRSLAEGKCTLKCCLYFHIDPDEECKKFIVSELNVSNESKNNNSKWKDVFFNLCLKLAQQIISTL